MPRNFVLVSPFRLRLCWCDFGLKDIMCSGCSL